MTKPLTGRFVRDGFVKLTAAVPLPVVEACVDLLWEAIGLDRHDPSTWTQPVYWVGGMSQPPFVQAMNSVVLLQACDELAGPGGGNRAIRWGAFPCDFLTTRSRLVLDGTSRAATRRRAATPRGPT